MSEANHAFHPTSSPAVDTTWILRALMRGAPFQPATNYWRAVEVAVLARELNPHGRVLDLGCGDGKLTGVLLEAARYWRASDLDLVGVDVDPAETALAMASGLYARVHAASATSLPERAGSFDLVFSNSVLEHIEPIGAVLDEVGRLLRSGGRFVFTVPGPHFHRCLADAEGTRRDHYLREIDSRCAHLRYWDVARWRDELSKRGLVITRAIPYLTPRQTRRWESLSNWTGGLLYRVAELLGRRQQPIEIQRRLQMRRANNGLIGRTAGWISPLLALGAPLLEHADSRNEDEQHGCLCVSAVKDPDTLRSDDDPQD